MRSLARMRSMMRPARDGVPGPGEITIARAASAISAPGSKASLRTTRSALAGEALDLLHEVVGEGVVVVDDGIMGPPVAWRVRGDAIARGITVRGKISDEPKTRAACAAGGSFSWSFGVMRRRRISRFDGSERSTVMRKLAMLLLFIAVPCVGECVTEWGYQGNLGPANWGTLQGGRWRICATGISQSPININTNTIQSRPDSSLPPVTFSGTSGFDVENTGVDVKVHPKGGSWTLSWNGETATLQQFHVHVPAEHLDNGVRHDGEIHFVYALPGGRTLALAVWIKNGAFNNTLQKIINRKPTTCGGKNPLNETLSMVPAFQINWARYAVYRGSLTTPPCDEGVTFLFALQPIFATAAQLNALKVVSTGNARPLQWIKWRP